MKRVFRIIFALIGMLIGMGIASIGMSTLASLMETSFSKQLEISIYIALILLFGILFFILFPQLLRAIKHLTKLIESSLENVRLVDVGFGMMGLVMALIIAMLITFSFAQIPIPWLGTVLSITIYIILGYIGFTLPIKKREDIVSAFRSVRREKEPLNPVLASKKNDKKKNGSIQKLLDTSVIIDGRIFDICQTGFIEGPLVIPVFVLNELQLISDSADELKRNRGRRGLDILNKIQTELDIEVQITEVDFDDTREVDSKLVKLGKLTGGKIVTNDYNLNKVATVQGVDVLNINELANAVKPIVLPGEEMQALLVKGGKENNQAVAYLDDGTMIVVENGKKYIGDTITVLVTSILQTSAGRMIFAKPKR